MTSAHGAMVPIAGWGVPVQSLYGAVAVVAFLVAREVIRRSYTSPLTPRWLARLPDAIHLVPTGAITWRDSTRAATDLEELAEAGYIPAGSWSVPEVPGLFVALLVNPGASLSAAIFDHPHAGTWCEVSYRNEDASSTTFTSAKAIGSANRAGHRVERCPGYSACLLDDLAASEPHSTPLVPVSAEDAARRFEAAYSEQQVDRAA